MGEMKPIGISEDELAKLQTEAERLGLTLDTYARLQLPTRTDRGATARAIRARQTKVARRESVDLIRADRDTR